MSGKRAKYIVVKQRTGPGGTWEEHIIVFSMKQIHSDVADNFGSRKVVGAGFIIFGKDGPTCFGRSESLGVDSREEDTFLAELAFGEGY